MDAVIVIPVIGVTAVAVAIFKKKKKVYKFFCRRPQGRRFTFILPLLCSYAVEKGKVGKKTTPDTASIPGVWGVLFFALFSLE
ncbi:MAG: hypothetical protein IJ390_07330 [Lachnospiraceae bacterium]|nr:hypothetical protein [Lachnospiraceae bacterium]